MSRRPKTKEDVRITQWLAVGSYPTVMVAAYALFATAQWAGVHVTIASFSAALAGAALVTLHEAMLPHRREWKPTVGDVGNDALFMLVVQVALPYLLSITLVVALGQWLRAAGVPTVAIWPYDLSVFAQVALVMVLADLPRYWLHVAFHKLPALWRLHAVHHSPHRLYWMNVGRFHVGDKALQYCVDTLPFLLLAVAPEVLAGYFVFYAVNGFYQHSNCEVRLGPLNYLVSGPELHRWHHSVLPQESNSNYGNNLIVWDLLFGTRFLPKDRLVGPLGLPNREYPLGFGAQLATPFRRGLLEP